MATKISHKRVPSQPVLARLLPRQPVLLTLGQVVVIPGNKTHGAEPNHHHQYQYEQQERPEACASIAHPQRVVVMVVHLDRSVATAAWVRRGRGFDDDGLARLQACELGNLASRRIRTAMLSSGACLQIWGCGAGRLVVESGSRGEGAGGTPLSPSTARDCASSWCALGRVVWVNQFPCSQPVSGFYCVDVILVGLQDQNI